MLLHTPVTRLLGGFHFDPSIGIRDKRWCCYFVQPLYVPEESIVLNWGWRIPWLQPTNPGSYIDVFVHGTDSQVEETIRIMIEQGLSKLEPMLTLQGFYGALSSGLYDHRSSNYFRQEALAYTAVLLGNEASASNHLREGEMILTMLDAEQKGLEDFELSLLERFRSVRKLLVEGGIEAATQQLDDWQRQMIDVLRIEDLMSSTVQYTDP